ncbi:MAG: aldo/keto reductase [Candidatus Latescibacterota bacterium]
MNRREFIAQSVTMTAGAALAGCAAAPRGRVRIEKEMVPFSTKADVPKPSNGTMPAGEIGRTGIKVSKLGFGSHLREDIIHLFDERQKNIRAAYDLGVTLFDVYDIEQKCFQYEPLGKQIKPFIREAVISIAIFPYEGRTFEQEFERDLRLFGRDYIDLVRVHGKSPDSPEWAYYEKLFKLKEKGQVRAVGVPIHKMEELTRVMNAFPIDYVFFPYGFFHNKPWYEHPGDNFDSLPALLRSKGVGVVTMKAFAGDYLVAPLKKVARRINREPEISFTKACLRYVINSETKPDATMVGMYNLTHVYENVDAFFHPDMTAEERELLQKVKETAYTG